MKLNEYQNKAMTTCMDTCDNFSYMFINLVGEIGEFASKVAKAIRKGEVSICDTVDSEGKEHEGDFFNRTGHDSIDNKLKLEAGDILWQLSGLCQVMGWNLEEIAQMNLAKLAARKAAGTIDGNGDGILNR